MCSDPLKVLVAEGDVSKEDDVLRMFRLTIEKFGECSLLHNHINLSDHPIGRLDMLFNVSCSLGTALMRTLEQIAKNDPPRTQG